MPAVRDVSFNLRTREVLRRQGLGGKAKIRPRTEILIRELLARVKKSHLMEPAAAYEYYAVSGMGDSQISLEGNKAIHGPLLPAIFPEAKDLAVIVVTIGPKLEQQVADYNKEGEVMRAAILDGIGSTAVDMTAVEVLRHLAGEVAPRGYEVSGPANPGMPGFPLTEQWNLLGLVNADEIGVALTATGVLVPRKSTSMVVGIGPHMTRWTQAEVCARCCLSETCQHKTTE